MPAAGFGSMVRVGNLWCYCIPFQEFCYQLVHFLGYTVLIQGGTDSLPGGDKVRPLSELNGGSYVFRVSGCP